MNKDKANRFILMCGFLVMLIGCVTTQQGTIKAIPGTVVVSRGDTLVVSEPVRIYPVFNISGTLKSYVDTGEGYADYTPIAYIQCPKDTIRQLLFIGEKQKYLICRSRYSKEYPE